MLFCEIKAEAVANYIHKHSKKRKVRFMPEEEENLIIIEKIYVSRYGGLLVAQGKKYLDDEEDEFVARSLEGETVVQGGANDGESYDSGEFESWDEEHLTSDTLPEQPVDQALYIEEQLASDCDNISQFSDLNEVLPGTETIAAQVIEEVIQEYKAVDEHGQPIVQEIGGENSKLESELVQFSIEIPKIFDELIRSTCTTPVEDKELVQNYETIEEEHIDEAIEEVIEELIEETIEEPIKKQILEPVSAVRERPVQLCNPIQVQAKPTPVAKVEDDIFKVSPDWATKPFGWDDADSVSDFSEASEDDPNLFVIQKPSFEHYGTKLPDGTFKCAKCETTFTKEHHLKSHRSLHLEKTTVCFYCGVVLADVALTKMHEYNVHRAKEIRREEDERKAREEEARLALEDPKEAELKATDLVCYECGKNDFKSMVKYNDHQNTHTKVSPYICSCLTKFRNYTNFYTHRKKFGCSDEGCVYPDYAIGKKRGQKPKPNTEVSEPEEPKAKRKSKKYPNGYFCAECNRTFKRASEANDHNAKFHMDKTIPCPQCNKLFATKVLLNAHVRHHYVQERCTICGTIVKGRYMYQHRKRFHPDVSDNYPCDECKYTTTTAKALRYHRLRRHSGVKRENKQREFERAVSVTDCFICGQKVQWGGMGWHFTSEEHKTAENDWKVANGVPWFSCRLCKGKQHFEIGYEFFKHMSNEHKMPPEKCLDEVKSFEIIRAANAAGGDQSTDELRQWFEKDDECLIYFN